MSSEGASQSYDFTQNSFRRVGALSQSPLLPYPQLRREGRGGAEAPLSLLLIYPTPSDVG